MAQLAVGPKPPSQPDVGEAYHEFRGPGDMLKTQTEQHARDVLKDVGWDKKAGAGETTQIHHAGEVHNPRKGIA